MRWSCRIAPGAADRARSWPNAIELLQRGALRRIVGRAVAANLPAHIPQRMTDRARAVLGDLGVPVDIEAQQVTAACPGAGIFLVAEYEEMTASFSALGRLGKPSEAVADEAVAAFREHHAFGRRGRTSPRGSTAAAFGAREPALPPSRRRGRPAIS